MYICRKVGLQFVERIVKLFGEFQRTGIRLFCHSEQYCQTCLLACHAELGRLVAYLDVCDIGKRYHALAVFLHDAGTDLVDIVGRGDAADDIFVAVFIAHTTIGVRVHAACAGHNFGERHTEMLHLAGTDEYLVFFDVTSVHAYLCHATR